MTLFILNHFNYQIDNLHPSENHHLSSSRWCGSPGRAEVRASEEQVSSEDGAGASSL